MSDETARAAAERSAQAILAGNFVAVMSDLTAEAMAQMMQMATQQGVNPSSLSSVGAVPGGATCEIIPVSSGPDGAETFRAEFASEKGRASVETTWKQVAGQWKIASFGAITVDPAAGAAQ